MWLTSGKTYSDLVSNTNSFVSVGDTGNPAYSGGMGLVGNIDYTYQISKYEITNKEYVLFLNSVDPFGTNPNSIAPTNYLGGAGDIRHSSSRVAGDRYYSNINLDNKPVNSITLSSMVRFCNWLHNGGKRYRVSDSSASAPQNYGAYYIGTITPSNYFAINVASEDNRFRLPSYSEWFKAAYYNGSGSYYSYATQSNNIPISVFANSSGDGYLRTLNSLSNLELDILRNNGSVFTMISNAEIDVLRNNSSVFTRISNSEMDVLRNNNSKFNITNNDITKFTFDIFSSTTNNIYLSNIIAYNRHDILISPIIIVNNIVNFTTLDTFHNIKTEPIIISNTIIDFISSSNKNYFINYACACDILCNKKS